MPKQNWVIVVVLIAVFGGMCLGTQWWDEAWRSELSFEPDEPAHFVTGLMIHEYLSDGMPGNPMRYAERYYLRYPKVAIGHWPPLFYAIEALWFFPFGGTIDAALGLQAIITACLALTVFLALRPLINWWALTPAAWLIMLRSTRFLSGAVMLELLAALFEMAAVYSWIRYSGSGMARFAYGFAFAASGALMTRGDAMFLTLYPLIAIALSGHWKLLRRSPTWISAGVVGLLCGPWYVLTLKMVQDGWQAAKPSFSYFVEAMVGYGSGLPELSGGGILILALLGIVLSSMDVGRERWAGWVALAASLLLFQGIVPASVEERRMAPLAPALLVLAGFGAVALRRRFSLPIPAGGLLVAAIAVHWMVARTPAKRHFGYRELVAQVMAMPESNGRNVLTSSAIDGEGMTISEVAAKENSPVRYVLRASKLLANSNWNGGTYQSLFDSPEKMIAALESSPAQIVICDTFPDHTPELTFEVHNGMLHKTIAAYPNRFRLLARRPGPEGEIFAYLLDEGHKQDGVKLEIDLGPKLGRSLRE